jgi:hypothetical protein
LLPLEKSGGFFIPNHQVTSGVCFDMQIISAIFQGKMITEGLEN